MQARVRRYSAFLVLLLAGLFVSLQGVQAREPAVDPDEMVAVELATVGMNPATRTPVVLLREPVSGDIVPIAIGVAEARAILLALHESAPPRPQTHDLMRDLLDALDARLSRILIDDLRDGTYHGALELAIPEREESLLVDSRPSDALALAARTGATILVAPRILISARDLEYEGLDQDQVVTAVGITVVEVTDELRDALGLPDEEGVLVSGVRGEAADQGLAAGDLILSVDDAVPESPMDFLDLIRRSSEDEPAIIRYWQDGEERSMELDTGVPEVDPDAPGIQL
ncbi:DUF151 domain-containing protein [Methylonatrum kenyense]|uniref:bifunctional nuclease domain-containing protein n=1 Tax=Methylonatrum kenyense TaxID=455253 RepID=UPI0020C03A3E|nr:bifunctional nuclease domain-containing protein [Methylonatrum kenyense]MCK8516643.1 DUF151 domain-containing protein [Methylonatrum kenyense]